MKLVDFIKTYPDEEACKERFKLQREKEGVHCKSCGGKEHWWLKTKEMYQCRHCKRRMSLRSGTVMENSKLPFRIWFLAMHLMTSTKKNISALEMQRQLGLNYYEPVWSMMHKIRRVMANREDKHRPTNIEEVTLAHIKIRSELSESSKKKKFRRRFASVKVTAESIFNERRLGRKRSFQCGHFKIQVLEPRKKIKKDFVDGGIKKTSETQFQGDKPRKRDSIKFAKQYHIERPLRKSTLEFHVWIKMILGNAKATLLDIYHGVSSKYVQNYLSEFCYKMNRRISGTNVFERLLAASTSAWYL